MVVLTTCLGRHSCAQAPRSHDSGSSPLVREENKSETDFLTNPDVSDSRRGVRMSAAGQTINDRILAARHSLAGQVGAMVTPVTLTMVISTTPVMITE